MSGGRPRHTVVAIALGLLGAALSSIAFLVARHPAAARAFGAPPDVLALVAGLAFTALVVAAVRHFGRSARRLETAYHDLHRAILQHERSEGALRESERFIRSTLDALDAQVAVLDADGVVMAVNRAWRAAADSGLCDVGANYPALCEAARGDRAQEAAPLAQGLREVLAGRREVFVLEHRAPGEERWSLTRASRFPGNGPLRVVVVHADVTPLRRADHESDEARRDREAEAVRRTFATLAAASPVGVFRADARGGLVEANQRLLDLAGMARPDALGGGWLRAADRDDAARVAVALERALAGDDAGETSLRFVGPTGDVRTCELRASVLRDHAGRTDGLVGTVVDVTQARHTERALRLAEASLERAPVAIYWLDAAGRIRRANRAAYEMLGWSADELRGMTLVELCAGDGGTRPAAHPPGARRTVRGVRAAHRRKDGSLRAVEMDRVPIESEGEACEVVFVRDVTERTQVDDRLARERALLRTVLDLDPHPVVAKDREGRFRLANRAAAELYGTTTDGMLGKTDADFGAGAETLERRRREDLAVLESGLDLTIPDDPWEDATGTRRRMRTVKRAVADAAGRPELVLGVSVDVTALAEAERTARAGEERFRTLVEHVPAAVLLFDATGGCVYANLEWTRLSGQDGAESLGEGWWRAVHPDDEPALRIAWRTVARQEPTWSSEFRVRTGAGAERWLRVLAEPIAGADGETRGVAAALVDVTAARLAAREGLAHDAELERRIAERTDERDRFRDELHRAEEDRRRAEEGLRSAQERLHHAEDELRRAAAGLHRAEAAARDAEEGGRQAAERARELYDQAPCGYLSLDGEATIVGMNDTGLGWLGRARDDLVGQVRLPDLLTPASRRAFREGWTRFTQAGRHAGAEYDLVRKDGTLLPVRFDATAVRDGDGRHLETRVTLVDATERRRAAVQVAELRAALVRRAEAVERAHRELDALAHAVSHDLRAPLHAIDDVARTLAGEQAGRLDDAGQRHLAVVAENASRMAHLVDALHELSRLGRHRFAPSRVDMAALARSVADELRSGAGEREVTVNVGEMAPATGDPALLRQVLASLLGNAFTFTSGVAHACVDVGSVEQDGTPVYYVRDNGAGFDMRYLERLFHAFERLHAPREFEGAGIGLAIVRRIVERHGGRVWAEGRPGQGATFFFTLGVPPAIAMEVPAPPASASHGAGDEDGSAADSQEREDDSDAPPLTHRAPS